jgi:hypothetical protein
MWEKLSTFHKVVFVVFISFLVPLMPELILLADAGGVELVFTFLVLYFKPILTKVQMVIYKLKVDLAIAGSAFKSSAFYQPKVFTLQAVFSVVAVIVTGSFIYAGVFFMPALILNGVLV